ncbi:hypothetical protein ACP4OV_001298 [Aristida adscensionis]
MATPAPSSNAAAPPEAAAAEEAPVLNEEPMVVREQDQLLPIANVVRIMRRGLPPYAKIADDAKDAVQECVSEFISFLTAEANDRCRCEHRKTITADDIVSAMARLGFDDYVAPTRAFVQRMRESEAAAAGGGHGPGRGDHARPRAHRAPPSAPTAALRYGAPAPMHHPAAVYMRPPPLHAPQGQAYAVPFVPPPPPHYAVQYGMLGGERAMVGCYGGPAFQAGGAHGGGSSDEASSSSEVAPSEGAGSQ